MKQIIAFLLTLSILIGLCMPVCAAQQAGIPVAASAAEDIDLTQGDYPVIFLTGIGQNWYHLLDEDGNRITMPDSDDPIEFNILYLDKGKLREPATIRIILRLAFQLVFSAMLDVNLISQKDVQELLKILFWANILDENGHLPDCVESPLQRKPLSEYDESARHDFFRSIPCQDLISDDPSKPGIPENMVYSYTHSAFDYLYDDAEGLDDFITNVVKPQTGKSSVVLITMSMGAAVASAYLQRHEYDRNDVKRIVSIVGAWDGSDLVADLIEKKYAKSAPQLLYNGIAANYLKEPSFYCLINLAMRLFPKSVLHSIVERVSTAFSETLILPTPSLMALIPHDRYPAIEKAYLSGEKWDKIRAMTHEYYLAQCTLPDRLRRLESKGLEIFFLSGYGLSFCSETKEYKLMQFFDSATSTNSDEIIQIQSTTLGASSVPYDSEPVFFGPYASDDGTIDLSTAYAPDRTWCFYRQIHQLDYNNTALRLAMQIATGQVRDVHSSSETFPQFNDARALRPLITDGDWNYIRQLGEFIDENSNNPAASEQVSHAVDLKQRCEVTLNSTHNDSNAEENLLRETESFLIEVGKRSPEEPPKPLTTLDRIMLMLNDIVMRIFGAAGFRDSLLPS